MTAASTRAPGPFWTVPMEAVRAMATGAGTAALTRLALRHVSFRPHALIALTDLGFVADVAFEEPALPGREQRVAVQLIAVPQENARLQEGA